MKPFLKLFESPSKEHLERFKAQEGEEYNEQNRAHRQKMFQITNPREPLASAKTPFTL